MARQTTHPQKRARREAALERREKQLVTGTYPDPYSPTGERNINRAAAEQEIANLKTKLGPFYAKDSE
jgi:hypothetical protein